MQLSISSCIGILPNVADNPTPLSISHARTHNTSLTYISTHYADLPNFYTPAERVSLTQILLKRHALSPSLYQPRLATLPATPAMRKTASTSSSPGQEHGNISPIRLQDEMISLLTQDAMIHMPNSPGKVQISVPRDESQPMELEV